MPTRAPEPPPSGKLLLHVLAGYRVHRPPVWLMRQAGRYLPEYRALRARARDFLDFCYRPALAAEAALQPVRRFGLHGAIVFSDILTIPDALGAAVSFVDGEGPRLAALETPASAARLKIDGMEERLAAVYETVERVAAEAPKGVATIGFAGAPWTLAAYMIEGRGSREFQRPRRWMHEDPAGFAALSELLETAAARHLVAQIRAGAEAVQLFDSWAGVLPPAEFRRWCIEPAARIAAEVRAACPGARLIGFPRGAGMSLRDYAARAGMNAVSLDTAVPPAAAACAVPPRMALQGNLDPMLLAVGGPAMARAVARLRGALGASPWIFNLGHGVLPETPPENVAALCAMLRNKEGE